MEKSGMWGMTGMNQRKSNSRLHQRLLRPRTTKQILSHRSGRLTLLAFLAGALALTACGPGPVTFTPTQRAPAPLPITYTPSPVPTVTSVPPTPTPSSTPLPTAVPPSLTPAPLFPDPQSYLWMQVVAGLDQPVFVGNAGDDSGRLFILEQPGVILILQNGALLTTPFLDIRDRVNTKNYVEQGLLGLAFDPNFQQNGYFYVNYTDSQNATVVARFSVTSNPNRADPNSETIILHIPKPYPNHNAGMLAFGPDGYLYIGEGDGGSEGDPLDLGQSLNTLLGKLLRIDVEHGSPYAIPADNPFANGGGKPEVWAYGLRNPWRFSFDSTTGDLYIADVGQDLWEEVDYLPAGSPGGTNFGWSYREGDHPYKGTPPAGITLTDPVFEYSHSEGGCAISGGYVYRGQELPAWQGVYLFGDYCSGLVWGLKRSNGGAWVGQILFQTGSAISSFGVDQSGEIYLVDRHGTVYKLTAK
ncbi:MAG: PQQ-dependent sugar dehydrogenase [Chloroflexi bacterium]|nr:PQQ-dependent sugar dehydrogenase [Chloroflexota bacterium]